MKNLLKVLRFQPKENTANIWVKSYENNYIITIDFDKEQIDYGKKIKSESWTTQNFSQEENLVVLECVDRLLEKGYKPEDITLEKVYPSGHGHSGRLDILVEKEGKAFLMIECKVRGKEFDKELNNINRNWGQLFTYFQQDRDTKYMILYTSQIHKNEIEFKNEIIIVEESYKETSNVLDLYNRWNKLTKQNWVFEKLVFAYGFESKALIYDNLVDIKEKDASKIFNTFLEILRHNTVSDKPNAFNKMFTLFLCKIYDELINNWTNKELDFQWKEWKDTNVSFQVRLTDLYKKWMEEFLKKQITDFSEEDFNDEFWSFILDETVKQKLLEQIQRLRLQKNNEFAIKEVFDEKSFEENAKVLKEVVQLLEWYRLRYTKKQPFLWDFFELLLTTGLKQEAGQFFTPVPVARFICKSIPIEKIIDEKISKGNLNDILPNVVDYAAWSWHFILEAMEEIQNIINKKDTDSLNLKIKSSFQKWKIEPYEFAKEYVYWIENDYRLVRTSKVGCYLHGDWIATVIHWDGLDSFSSEEYRGKLSKKTGSENENFDLVLSNPPYSVSAFKGNLDREKAKNDFTLYDELTDNSSEIECLFIERTKQLLKEWGIASIILPSSILNNSWIYTKAREIILKNFEIVAITALWSNTFMATWTNTVVLFMRKRNKFFAQNIELAIEKFFTNLQDITVNGVEKIFSKYASEVRQVSFEDYKTLWQKNPNEKIKKSELFREYAKKIKLQKNETLEERMLAIEKEKLLYFLLTYPQKVVLVKSGEKDKEKRFLGYEFSFRKWSEWIHSMQQWKLIDECTKLFDPERLNNPEKTSTYVYTALNEWKFDLPIHKDLQDNVSYQSLVDMLTFDRVDFEKTISLSVKKKTSFNKIRNTNKLISLWDVAVIRKGTSTTKENIIVGDVPVVAGGKEPAYFHNQSNRNGNVITVSASGANAGFVNYFTIPIFASDSNTIESKDEKVISTKLIFYFLKSIQTTVYWLQRGQAQPHVYGEDLAQIQIPLPPLDIQEKIVKEIEEVEKKENESKKKVENLRNEIENKADALYSKYNLKKLGLLSNEPIYWANESATNWNPNTDYRYIRITDINDSWTLNNDWKTAENVEEKYILKQWDFLFARSGATAWKTFLYRKEYGKALFAGYLIRFEVKSNLLLPEFLNFALKWNSYKNWVLEKRQWTAQPNINAQQFSSFEIPLPPLTDQQKIVKEIETIEKEITKLEAELAQIPAQKESILKKYL